MLTEAMEADDVRPFLNSHFMTCRLLSRYMPPPGASQRAEGIVAALKRYRYLKRTYRALCEKKGLDYEAVFGKEGRVCDEMVELLPSKIDRVHFHGDFS